jgi:p-aminobenzoyl-glutamate transporter AbgT
VQCLMQSAVADTLVVGFIWNDFFAPSLNLLRRSGASDYLRTLEFWAEVVPIFFLPMLALVRWRKRSIHIAFRCSISCTNCFTRTKPFTEEQRQQIFRQVTWPTTLSHT